MAVAYLSEIEGNLSTFRAVDAPGLQDLIRPGDSRPLEDVYCQHIIEGRLPSLIPDTAAEPLAQTLLITTQVPIGSHVSVPVRRADGSLYGMFCCLSPEPNPSLNLRDLAVMEMFANLCAEHVNAAFSDRNARERIRSRVERVLEKRDFDTVYQPIYHLNEGRPRGYEALSRFRETPYRSPDLWFAEADKIGLGPDLELAAIEVALEGFDQLPRDAYMSVNASPKLIRSGSLADVFDKQQHDRVVLEVTEHQAIDDLPLVIAELYKLRSRGILIAIDDAGAGYSGLQQIIRLSPDILKLDMSLTTGIDTDAIRRSLAAAMVHFAREQGSVIVAEGVETEGELRTLKAIGVHCGQGWLLGKPGPLPLQGKRGRPEDTSVRQESVHESGGLLNQNGVL